MQAVGWEDFARLASAPVTVTVQGSVRSTDMTPYERVHYAPPDNWRVEDDSGNLHYLANDTGHYQLPAGGGRASFTPRRPGRRCSGDTTSVYLVHPRELVRPVDDDFTHPMGPVRETVFVGRRAWRVLLAPPPRKPQPVWQILDVASGITLAYQSLDGAGVVEFTSVVTDIELPPDTFAPPVDLMP